MVAPSHHCEALFAQGARSACVVINPVLTGGRASEVGAGADLISVETARQPLPSGRAHGCLSVGAQQLPVSALESIL